MEAETAKNAEPLDEIAVIRKMVSDRENSAKIYSENNRVDLAKIELDERNILLTFLPEQPTEDEVRLTLSNIALDIEIKRENIGIIMKKVKSILPTVDMKMVNQVVNELMKK